MDRTKAGLPREDGSPMLNIRTINVTVRFICEPDDGGFHVYCPELKGLHVAGKTEEEALENAKRAAELHIFSLLKHNDPLPVGSQDTTVSLGDVLRNTFARFFGRQHTVVEGLSITA